MRLLNISLVISILLFACSGEHLREVPARSVESETVRAEVSDTKKDPPDKKNDKIPEKTRPRLVENTLDYGKLRALFERSERDLKRAIGIVTNKDIIKNLTHFQSMDSGGRKYYLLEREAISEMIHSATEGRYDEWVIINKTGRIIYTMRDNEVFNKLVTSQLKGIPYDRCHVNHEMPLYIDDTSSISTLGAGNYLVFSAKAQAPDTRPGLLLLVLNANYAVSALPAGAWAVGTDGLYKAAADLSLINTPYPFFEKIPPALSADDKSLYYFSGTGGKQYVCRYFRYAGHTWILVAERYMEVP